MLAEPQVVQLFLGVALGDARTKANRF